MRANNEFQGGYVRYFADDAAGSAARSLQFLRVIEDTLVAVSADTERYTAIAKFGHMLADKLRNEPLARRIDVDGTIESALQSAMTAMCTIKEHLSDKREAARADTMLRSDDGVVEGFDAMIEALRNAHESLCEVLWALTEHDIDQEQPSPKVYKTVDELFASLKV